MPRQLTTQQAIALLDYLRENEDHLKDKTPVEVQLILNKELDFELSVDMVRNYSRKAGIDVRIKKNTPSRNSRNIRFLGIVLRDVLEFIDCEVPRELDQIIGNNKTNTDDYW